MKHIPRKRFGQNFLKDPSVLDAIIDAIDPRPEDTTIEIGPGMGAMTERLLLHLKQLDAVELDRDLVFFLQKKFKNSPLTIHQGDALVFDFLSIQRHPEKKLRIVGNLPYNISTPLLFHLMAFADHVRDQHFMLQKEVVERMAAEHGSKAYGRLSIMLQWRYDIDMLFIVPPTAFEPAPKVDSAIIRMIPKTSPIPCSLENLSKVVTQAFSQRRKIIRNTLAPLFSETELEQSGIDPAKRPEQLTLEQFITLSNQLLEPQENSQSKQPYQQDSRTKR